LGITEAVGAVPDWYQVTVLKRNKDAKQAELNNVTAKLNLKREELVKVVGDLRVSIF